METERHDETCAGGDFGSSVCRLVQPNHQYEYRSGSAELSDKITAMDYPVSSPSVSRIKIQTIGVQGYVINAI